MRSEIGRLALAPSGPGFLTEVTTMTAAFKQLNVATAADAFQPPTLPKIPSPPSPHTPHSPDTPDTPHTHIAPPTAAPDPPEPPTAVATANQRRPATKRRRSEVDKLVGDSEFQHTHTHTHPLALKRLRRRPASPTRPIASTGTAPEHRPEPCAVDIEPLPARPTSGTAPHSPTAPHCTPLSQPHAPHCTLISSQVSIPPPPGPSGRDMDHHSERLCSIRLAAAFPMGQPSISPRLDEQAAGPPRAAACQGSSLPQKEEADV